MMGTFDFCSSFSGGRGSSPRVENPSQGGAKRPWGLYGVGTYAKVSSWTHDPNIPPGLGPRERQACVIGLKPV